MFNHPFFQAAREQQFRIRVLIVLLHVSEKLASVSAYLCLSLCSVLLLTESGVGPNDDFPFNLLRIMIIIIPLFGHLAGKFPHLNL